MKEARTWPRWWITFGWSSDIVMAVQLENCTQWQTSGALQQWCGSCWQCVMRALPSDRETRIDPMQSSGDCSLGPPLVDLELSKKRGTDGVFVYFWWKKTWHSLGFSTPFCQSQSFLNSNFHIDFQPCCTHVGCQILCLPGIWLSMGRAQSTPIHLIAEKKISFRFLKGWSRIPGRPKLRKCLWSSYRQKETKAHCLCRNGYVVTAEGSHLEGWSLGSCHTNSWQLHWVGKPWVQPRALNRAEPGGGEITGQGCTILSSSFVVHFQWN